MGRNDPMGQKDPREREGERERKRERGREWEGTICMFFDANTGLYFWLHTMWPSRSGHPKSPDVEFFLQEGKVFLLNNKIVFFDYPRFLQLSDRASSLDDAERKSIIAATVKLQEGEGATIYASRRPFDTGLSRDFETPPYSSMSIRPRIIDAQYKNSQWLLTIQGVWKEIVTLDDQFRLLGHTPAPGETPKYWRTARP